MLLPKGCVNWRNDFRLIETKGPEETLDQTDQRDNVLPKEFRLQRKAHVLQTKAYADPRILATFEENVTYAFNMGIISGIAQTGIKAV